MFRDGNNNILILFIKASLTTERDDMAAVCVDKLSCDCFLHDLLHLKDKYTWHSAKTVTQNCHPILALRCVNTASIL